MKTRRGLTSVKWAALKTGFSALLIIGTAFSQIGIAQSEGKDQEAELRTLEILDVGYKLPIEIVAIRNVQSDHWMRDLELEIKNISHKPIYEAYVTLFLPDDKDSADRPYGVNLQYGRLALIDPDRRPWPEDKPIQPGESALLRVDERISSGYEVHLRTKNVPKEASNRIRMILLAVNFGDGTGFINGGVPYPRDPRIKPMPHRYLRVQLDPRP